MIRSFLLPLTTGAALLLSACGSSGPVAAAPIGLAPEARAAVTSSARQSQTSEVSVASAASTTPASRARLAGPDAAAPSAAPPATPSSPPASPPAPAVPVKPVGTSATLGPLEYIRQTLNNCGPASIAEVLHYWGIERTQGQVQAVVRADGNTRGMMPFGVPGYVASLGLRSLVGVEGNEQLIKSLVANGFPVIVMQYVSSTDHYSHYRPIESFDDKRQVFVSSDPYLGPNHQISYAEFDQIWPQMNKGFLVIYPPGKQDLLNAVLSANKWDKTAAYQTATAKQQSRIDHMPASLTGRKAAMTLFTAWNDIQLGDKQGATQAIDQAVSQGANPEVVKWLQQDLSLAG